VMEVVMDALIGGCREESGSEMVLRKVEARRCCGSARLLWLVGCTAWQWLVQCRYPPGRYTYLPRWSPACSFTCSQQRDLHPVLCQQHSYACTLPSYNTDMKNDGKACNSTLDEGDLFGTAHPRDTAIQIYLSVGLGVVAFITFCVGFSSGVNWRYCTDLE
jgi:hypothetical protein